MTDLAEPPLQHSPDTGTLPEVDLESAPLHVGHAIARELRERGVEVLFTLSGAHLFSLYDGCLREGIRIVDVRHEQTAGFAAEAWAKTTRRPAACAVTAGPGVTNAMSAMASAQSNGSPVLFIGGRAPEHRWGRGSLQEIDHVPFVAPLVRRAATIRDPARVHAELDLAFEAMYSAPGGPAFIDLPLDVAFSPAEPAPRASGDQHGNDLHRVRAPHVDADDLAALAAALRTSRRPVVLAGSGVHWQQAEDALRHLAEDCDIPVLLNGLGRGLLAPDHPNRFSGARGAALSGCDLAIVVGTPIDFRLGFGDAIAAEATFATLDGAPPTTAPERTVDHALVGDIRHALEVLHQAGVGDGGAGDDVREARRDWLEQLGGVEADRFERGTEERSDPRSPLHPVRLIAQLGDLLEPDAVLVGDGGDAVSYAGRMILTDGPGSFLEPGPFGCLGAGPGGAIAAKLAHPDRQVCALFGDGAFGFAGMDVDTMVRLELPILCVIANNGIWGLEHHPMQALFGYSVTNVLQPGTRYDLLAIALGAHGELVTSPEELRPAIERAIASGGPAVVNVLTDPDVAYPRSTNLA